MSRYLKIGLMGMLAWLLALTVSAVEYHVATTGSDSNDGSSGLPFLTIQKGADVAQPGDTVTVHAGTYRERIDPPRGGTSDANRIVYQAAPGEDVIIKGSEMVTGWQWVANNTWEVTVPNSLFGAFNPFDDLIWGDWFNRLGRDHHTGAVYLNGHWLAESATMADTLEPAKRAVEVVPGQFVQTGLWHATVYANNTLIRAQFKDTDPNEEETEINVRQTVFYPSQTNMNYITVRGFDMMHAATPWAPPTAEQIGLIGVNWSKGWIIEDNDVRYSVCTGITLGKYGDEFDNTAANTAEGYVLTIDRALTNGWNKATVGSHLVRNNTIAHCEQAGIVGSLGAVFSTITGNTIHDIHVRKQFSGAEMAGIKFHAPIDCIISSNVIHHTTLALWLDWMTQGTRVTGNLFSKNEQDMHMEVNHGPFLVDHNILLSPLSVRARSRGGAYVHNIFAGAFVIPLNETRVTPYHAPHSTVTNGQHGCPAGDVRYYNNIFVGSDVSEYDNAAWPVAMEGNVYLDGAVPSTNEVNPIIVSNADGIDFIKQVEGGLFTLTYDADWVRSGRPLVTTAMLGNAMVPNAPFEHPDGSPYTIDVDYFGLARKANNPAVGPFELSVGGEQTVLVYSNDFVTVSPPPSPKVLAHWSFDAPASGGLYADGSGNGRDIAATVAPSHITSGMKFGSGAIDIGVNQYLTLADNPTTGAGTLPLSGKSFSISFWVQRHSLAGDQIVIGMADPRGDASMADKALHLGFRGVPRASLEGQAFIDFYADGLHHPDTSATTDLTSWHHYAMSYDAENKLQRIVIDGDSASAVTRIVNNDFLGDDGIMNGIINDFWIGRSFGNASFSGLVDEVWVFDNVLTSAEVTELYLSNGPPIPLENSDVLAHWSFDDPPIGGAYTDVSGAGNDIATTVGTAYNTGNKVFGDGALDVGNGEFLTLAGGLPLITNSFSICFWAKRDTLGVDSYVVGMSDATLGGSLHVGFRASNNATIDFWGDGLNHSDTTATTDTTGWHHYAFTYDATIKQQRIVIDGNVAGAQARTSSRDFLGLGGTGGTTDDFWIGKSMVSAAFDGLVDEVWVFDAVLSDVEITSLYSANHLPVPPSDEGVLAHWSFNEPPSGGAYADESGNGNDIAVTIGTTYIPGTARFGGGALDVGTHEYLTLVGGLPLIHSDFSISFWAKRHTVGVDSYVVGMSDATWGGSLHVGFRGANNNATIDFWGDGVNHPDTTASSDTDTWHHYVFTYDADSNQQRIIIDGNISGAQTRTSADDFLGIADGVSGTTDDFWIGKSMVSDLFDGLVDEVWVFKKVLPDEEVRSLYRANQLTVLAHWSFDAPPAGGVYADESGNGKEIAVTVGTAHSIGNNVFGNGALDVGNGEFLTLAGGLSLTNTSFSVCFWAKRDTLGVDSYVVGMSDASLGGSLHVGFRGSNNKAMIDFWGDGLNYSDTTATTDTTGWHHYAFTYDATIKQQRIVIDGNVAGAQARTSSRDFLGLGGTGGTTDDFWIGKSMVSAAFDGLVDEVWVFSDVLSDVDVLSLYSANILPLLSVRQAFSSAVELYTETEDADGDGWSNLYEYIFGGNPMSDENVGMTPCLVPAGNAFEYVYLQRRDAPSLIYSIETTTNLSSGAWVPVAVATETNAFNEIYNQVTCRIPADISQSYVRVKVQY